MKTTPFFAFIFLTAATLGSGAQATEYRWVSDVFYVPVRSGKSNGDTVINKGLKSGTRLELVNEESDWTQIKLDDGQTGYIRTRYLSTTAPAAMQIESLKQQYQTLQQQCATAMAGTADGAEPAPGFKLPGNIYDRPASPPSPLLNTQDSNELQHRLQEIMRDHQMVQTELEVLKAENERLKGDNRSRLIFAGAGAVGFGVLIALVLPLFQRRKRFSEWG